VTAFAQLYHHVGERSGFEDVPVGQPASIYGENLIKKMKKYRYTVRSKSSL
jgi:hypothetical protein